MAKTISIGRWRMHGCCPVCGTSWKGMKFKYHYAQYLTQKHIQFTDKELNRAIRGRHLHKHVSRLLHFVEECVHVCPDCGTVFKIKGYNYEENGK